MSGRGRPKGLPKVGGRVRGTPNKTTAEIREFARSYGRRAIRELARLAFHDESGAVQVAAIKELLNRGYGKAPKPALAEAGPHRPIVSWADRARNLSEPMYDPLAGLPPRRYPTRPLLIGGKHRP